MSLAALLAELNIDPYKVLGVPLDADLDTIKRVYHHIAFECHPDRNPVDPNCEERFKLATAAFEILSDPRKRAEYDGRHEYLRTQECMHHDAEPFWIHVAKRPQRRTGQTFVWPGFEFHNFTPDEINDYRGNKQPFLHAAMVLAQRVGRLLKRVGFTSKAHINQGGPAVSGEVYAHYGRNGVDVLVMYGTCNGAPCILIQSPHEQMLGNHYVDPKSSPSCIAGEVVRYYERCLATRR